MEPLTAHQQTVLLELRKILATLNKINSNLQQAINITAAANHSDGGSNGMTSSEAGALVKAQKVGLKSVGMWVDALAGGPETDHAAEETQAD